MEAVSAIIDRHAAAWLRRPFITGADDCGFAVRGILAEAGAFNGFQNRIGEFRSAAAIEDWLAEETGGGGLVALVAGIARERGWRRQRRQHLQDGDLALARDERGNPLLGIIRGPRMLTRARFGLAALPLDRVIVGYRVIYGT